MQKLGDSEPFYNHEESADAMFWFHVSCSLPLNSTGTKRRDIAVTGTKCSTLAEVESEASAAVLQEFQHGWLRICIMDVSRARCRELEKKCHETLANAHEVYQSVTLLLLGWEEVMNNVEGCYSPVRHRAVQISCHRESDSNGDIRPDVADQLADLTSAHYLKLKELADDTEKAKIYIEKVAGDVEYFFCKPCLQQINEHQGILTREMELSMRILLQDVTISIGWAWPSHIVTSSGASLYVCQKTLFPRHTPTGTEANALTITGSEASSEVEAVESSYKNALLLLEREKSIYLLDLNYNHRSHGELYVVEAREGVQNITAVGSNVLDQWELMVIQIHAWAQHCHWLALGQQGDEKARRLNSDTWKSVIGLYESCLSDLQIAKQWFNTVSG